MKGVFIAVLSVVHTRLKNFRFSLQPKTDHHGDLAEQTRKLDFWLTCVKRHFQAAKLPPPAILLNYLWTFNANGIAKKGWSIDVKPMTYAGELIDAYRDIGWDIAAVHVGAAVNITRLKKQTTELFDDMHHPSCTGVKFIADLLQHVFYSNLATQCTANSFPKRWERHTTTNSLIPPHATLTGNIINSTRWTQLWRDIFREKMLQLHPCQHGRQRVKHFLELPFLTAQFLN